LNGVQRFFRAIGRRLPNWRRGRAENGSDPRGDRAERSLFILGHARSGTTILQNALNDSRDVFLLGEADLHTDPGTPDFRTRYNARQRGFGNQENKSSFCPKLFDADAAWDAYLAVLMDHYRYAGAKIVVNPLGAEAAADQLFDFATRYFYRGQYIFSFRNPVDVLCSTQGMASFQGLKPESAGTILHSFLVVMRLHIRMLRNLPNVHAVFHEAMSPAVFAALGTRLGVDLGGAYRYYSNLKVRTYRKEDVAGDAALVEQVIALYEEFRRQALDGFELVQIEQNSGSIDPTHPTPLGRLYRGIEAAITACAPKSADAAA
jgi:hypothetical protein